VPSPSRQIVREVLRNRHDLVMIAAEGRGDLRESTFTTTALRLMRECPCPVWVLRRPRTDFRRRIMAAVDPDPMDERRDALNESVMDLAAALAELEDSELHVVHAWIPYGRSILTAPIAGLSADEVRRYLRETREGHERLLHELLLRHPPNGLTRCVHLVEGAAHRVIPEVAVALEVESIVMGTVCRDGVAGWVIGNTAEVVLRRVGCSMLIAKPEGFVSPVTPDD